MIAGFQGEPGAFSEEAVLLRLGPVETRGYRTFDDLMRAVASNEVDYGLMPCENTIAGPIARTYDLLAQYDNVRIIGQTTHAIEQCLIGPPGASVDRLERVASHPVALEQCRKFLSEHPRLAVDVADDTAGSVRAAVKRDDPKYGAIGPALAAERYGALVLQRSIQDDAENLTRFFLISTQVRPRRSPERICVALSLSHRPGSLHAALGVFAKLELNLRSLVARPDRRRPFQYVFYLEIDAPPSVDAEALLSSIHGHVRVLGRY